MSCIIINPAASALVNVGNEPTFPTVPGPGNLCRLDVRASTAQSMFLSSIYVRVRPGLTVPSDTETLGTSDRWGKVFAVNKFITGNLDKSAFGEVWAFRETAPSAINNSIKAIAVFFVPGGMPGMMVPFHDIDSQGFKGKVNQCDAPAPNPPPVIVPETQRHPSLQEGDWLLYEGLGLSPVDGGNVLMRNGEPLKANRIAVSVPRVSWTYGTSPPKVVKRAVGLYTAGDYTDRFRGVMRGAICVCQDIEAEEARGVIASESREQPDLVGLVGNDVIRVIPNVSYLHLQTLQGSFDLWVKVVD